MKKLLTLITCCIITVCAVAQAKKPTLMVVPSDAWCQANGFMQQFDNEGVRISIPDYKQAIQNSIDLKLVIAKINDLMAERGFELKDLEQQMKILAQQNAEQNMLTSKSGNEMAISPVDQIFNVAKADIIIEITWNITTQGPKKMLTYIMEGKDSYSGKSIGGSSGTGTPSLSSDVATLLEEAVLSHIDNFNNNLQQHFDDLFANGREVAINIRVFSDNDDDIDLETEYDGKELAEIIDDWMAENTQKGRFSKSGASENYINYEQVRIPLYDPRGVAMDAEMFARQLRNYLRKPPYNITVKVVNRGLGKSLLILGGK